MSTHLTKVPWVLLTDTENKAHIVGPKVSILHKFHCSDFYTLIGSDVDFNSNPIIVTFAAGEATKSFNISVMCDKIVESTEKFNLSLILTSNNAQVTIGNKHTPEGRIIDSTGKYGTIVSVGDDIIE